MKYLQTLVLTNPLLVALHEGQLKLQSGQWIKFDDRGKSSRFVRVTRGGSIWAVHPNGGRVDNHRFKQAIQNWSR